MDDIQRIKNYALQIYNLDLSDDQADTIHKIVVVTPDVDLDAVLGFIDRERSHKVLAKPGDERILGLLSQHPDTLAFSKAMDDLWQSVLDELGWLEYPVRGVLWIMRKLEHLKDVLKGRKL